MFGLKLIHETMLRDDLDDTINAELGGGSTEGGDGTWSKPFEEPTGSGQYWVYNSTSGEIKPFEQGPYADTGGSLEDDLAAIGLTPVTTNPRRTIDTRGFGSRMGSTHDETPYATDEFGEIYYRSGSPVTEALRKRLVGSGVGDGSGTDNTVGLANLAQRKYEFERQQAEQERAQRIEEAMSAIDQQAERRRAYLSAQLEGAGFSLPKGQEYFPALSPTSPAVRSGLADPFRVNPVNYDPSLALTQGNWQADLARIRAGSGG